ncbi:TOMM system kinase/cyclase fusion protein [bacterium]|nr:TOMM system kinase/cyclase fusion protein [bacterium]
MVTKRINDDHLKFIIKNYDIHNRIGTGGFGRVYKARQMSTGQLVAVKILDQRDSKDESDAGRIKRFQREIKLCAGLNHPNIIKILDSGQQGNELIYIVFEYLEGQNLAGLIKREGALTVQRATDLMLQLLDAMAAAHSQGIVHRDLKPENIMLQKTGAYEQAKILDFGIGTFLLDKQEASDNLTKTRDFLGTPAYSAPEQLRGEPVSTKTDLYSWGLTYLECLTGTTPFGGKSVAEVVRSQLSTQPVPLSSTLRNHQLGTFFDWVLQKSTDRRAGDASIVFSRLKSIDIEGIKNQSGYLVDPENLGEDVNVVDTIAVKMEEQPGERRQVTALCLSLVLDYSEMESEYEEIDEVFGDIQDRCISLIERAGGYVDGNVGEIIMGIFGFPEVADTDVRRAAGVALQVMTAMTQRGHMLQSQYGIELSVTIGLHTGMATVRKTKKRVKILGLTQNIAAKLTKDRVPGCIYLSDQCHELIKDFIKCEVVSSDISLPPGVLNVFRAIEEKVSKSVAGSVLKITGRPFVGRFNELHTLKQHFKTKGIPVFIEGEAGIGKSTLVAEFVRQVRYNSGRGIEFRCVPEGQKMALFPILKALRYQYELSVHQSANENIALLEAGLEKLSLDSKTILPILCLWFGYQTEKYPVPEIAPQKQKSLLFEAIAGIYLKMAQQIPTICIFEDLHWADTVTLEFLTWFSEVCKGKLLLLMTSRVPFPGDQREKTIESVKLGRLMDEEIEEIVRNVAGSIVLPHDFVATAIERSDGIPLFAREVIRILIDFERQSKGGTADKLKFEIPNTLQTLLASRLNKLGVAKETAQIASVIGRRFDYDLLSRLSLKDESVLLADLDQLLSAGIIQIQHRPGAVPVYYFYHSLICDSAYDSILQQQKFEIHGRVASILESEFVGMERDQPELLSYHWSKAGEISRAADYGLEAAKIALSKFLYQDAIEKADEALEWIEQLEDDESSAAKQLDLLKILQSATIALKGYASRETQEILSQSEKVSRKMSDRSKLLSTQLIDLYAKHIFACEYPKLDELSAKLNQILETSRDEGYKSLIFFISGLGKHTQGKLTTALQQFNQAIELYDDQRDAQQFAIFGHDAKIMALSMKSVLCVAMDRQKEADRSIQTAMKRSKALGNVQLEANVLAYKMGVRHYRRDKESIKRENHQLLELATKYQLPNWLNFGHYYQAWVDSDLDLAVKTFETWKQTNINIGATYWNYLIAQIEVDKGLYHEAVKRLNQYIVFGKKYGERYFLPELFLLKGLSLKALNENQADVKCCFQTAVSLAKEMGARYFVFKAELELKKK